MRGGTFGQWGAQGRHAGPQSDRGEGFFLKNSDAHGMYEVSSQEGKCLACVVSCGTRDLACGWGGGAYKCLQLQREGLVGEQPPQAEQLLAGGPRKPQERSQPPPTKPAPGGETGPLGIG